MIDDGRAHAQPHACICIRVEALIIVISKPKAGRTTLALTLVASSQIFAPAAHADNVLAPIWTGLYIGGHGGALWSDIDTDFRRSFSATEATGGAHAGFNLGFGPIVAGIEADATFDGVAYRLSAGDGEFSTDWSGTLRGRLGAPIGPALLYMTVGYAWNAASATTLSGGDEDRADLTFHGVVYGAGVEAKILSSLSVRLEALRFDYASDTLSAQGAATAAREFDPSDTVVRAGLTFHLN